MKLIIIISIYPLFVHEQLHVHSTNFEKKLNQIKTKLNNHKGRLVSRVQIKYQYQCQSVV